MTILIVEGDAAVRSLLVEVLGDFGCMAVGVRNRALALQYLQTAAEYPKLILLDLMMPGIDTRAICAPFHRHPTLAAIPIVVMSARMDLPDQARRLKAAAYLVKPFTVDTIEALVRAYVTKPFEQEAVQAIGERYHPKSLEAR